MMDYWLKRIEEQYLRRNMASRGASRSVPYRAMDRETTPQDPSPGK